MDEILNPTELAEYLGLSQKTLANWRSLRVGPLPLRAGHVIRYRKRDVEAWLDGLSEATRDWMAS